MSLTNVFGYARNREIELRHLTTSGLRGSCLSIMRYFVLNSRHTEGPQDGIVVGRGEIVASQADVMEETGLSRKQVRNALEHLKKLNFIRKSGTIGGANGRSLYIIENFDIWDGLTKKRAKQKAKEGPSKGQAPYKEEEEGKDVDSESVKTLSRTSGKKTGRKSFKEMKDAYPEAAAIVTKHWLAHVPLPDSVLKSDSAMANVIDKVRLIHTVGGLSWDQISQVVKFAALNWQPKGYCESPGALYAWTADKSCRRYEKIIRELGKTTLPITLNAKAESLGIEEAYRLRRSMS